MKKVLIISSLFTLLFTVNSFAQFNPAANDSKMLSVGLGVSGWGIPIYGRYEFSVADNITVGGVLSYQSKRYGIPGFDYRLSYFGIAARGSYHFNELLGADDKWDFYAGATLGYYFSSFSGDAFAGSNNLGDGGLGVGVHIGARYFINEKIALNAEFGGGSAVSGATIGVTFML
ncbi:MAG: hypothetical protein L3J06_03430 [Cyclobacteriaceae bacterium]|nr:hypothetical protein [Cyclobacteriaceae bacterium]